LANGNYLMMLALGNEEAADVKVVFAAASYDSDNGFSVTDPLTEPEPVSLSTSTPTPTAAAAIPAELAQTGVDANRFLALSIGATVVLTAGLLVAVIRRRRTTAR
jgi:LPXTG-motif cell wall-anchored protein